MLSLLHNKRMQTKHAEMSRLWKIRQLKTHSPETVENRHPQTSVVGVYTRTIFTEGQFTAPRKITNTYAL